MGTIKSLIFSLQLFVALSYQFVKHKIQLLINLRQLFDQFVLPIWR